MSRVAYFDCFGGAAGDMIVAALLHAGGDLERLRALVEPIAPGMIRVGAKRVERAGLAATRFSVEVAAGDGVRGVDQITALVTAARLPERVRRDALAVFGRLAAAEGRVHGVAAASVHLHEAGALDAIADVVGACVLLDDLGVDEIRVSAFPLGSGSVAAVHGTLPVPAPAVVELLEGWPVRQGDGGGELVTPTGAALLTTLATGHGGMPDMTLSAVGVGAGARETPGRPNVLRVLLGRREAVAGLRMETLDQLETNLDDQPPQQVAYVTEELLAAGALDVWTTPITMKKGRAAVSLSVLCEPRLTSVLVRRLLRESTSLGVRVRPVARAGLDREMMEVDTPWGPVPVKVARLGDEVLNIMPETDPCVAIARREMVPLKNVQQVVMELARARLS